MLLPARRRGNIVSPQVRVVTQLVIRLRSAASPASLRPDKKWYWPDSSANFVSAARSLRFAGWYIGCLRAEPGLPSVHAKEAAVKNRLLVVCMSTVISLAATGMAVAQTTNARARLFGTAENPTLSTTGRGLLDVVIDETAQTITYELTYNNLEGVGTTPYVTDGVVTAAHIHLGAVAVNGGVSAFLCGGGDKPACPTPSGMVSGVIDLADIVGPGSQGINDDEATRFAELVRAIKQGVTYANVHTTRWPSGEIRGQLRVLP
jgi:hypothetical protein